MLIFSVHCTEELENPAGLCLFLLGVCVGSSAFRRRRHTANNFLLVAI
jgi:hypothetical protein